MSTGALVEVRNVEMAFKVGRHKGKSARLQVLRDLSLDVARGETLGLVGESGSGKSTAARVVVGLHEPTAGTVKLFGRLITGPERKLNLAAVRSRTQFVFQDPQAALDPRMRVGDSVAEPIDVAGAHTRRDRNARVQELLAMVARALALEPAFIVCDEPVSALDVSMQAQVVNLLMDLQARFGIGYLFIAHDLAVVRAIADRVAVIYSGAIVEVARKDALYSEPAHPYTRALLDAVPRPDPARARTKPIAGEVPSLFAPPPGCRFHARCPHVMPRCQVEEPVLREVAPARLAACHLYDTTQTPHAAISRGLKV
jgi:oligopeptide/dipeptide ABC transporter ATP-binding protein